MAGLTRKVLSHPIGVLLWIAIAGALLVAAVALTYAYDAFTLAVSVAGFLILLLVAAWLAYTRRRAGLQAGAAVQVGILLGILWVVEIGINNFVAPPLPARDYIDNLFWGAIALIMLAYAAEETYRTGDWDSGIRAGAWCGLASGLVACGMALGVIVFGMGWIARDPLNIAEWAERGPTSGAPGMAAYFAYQTFAGAFLHLIVLGLGMGALLGVLGALVGQALRGAGRLVHPAR